MIHIIYIIITIYFVLGALGFFFINRKKNKEEARQNWIKFISYYLIINVMFFGITINSKVFSAICTIILILAYYEIIITHLRSDIKQKRYFIMSLVVITFLAFGLLKFSLFSSDFILFVFILLSIFDSFSQISGQIFGKHKICPTISPKKTYEGVIGGTIITVLSSFVLRDLYSTSSFHIILCALIICISAFCGDLAASSYKRKYHIKDFSQLIPGHGGVLDRFDSLIGAGAFIGYLYLLI